MKIQSGILTQLLSLMLMLQGYVLWGQTTAISGIINTYTPVTSVQCNNVTVDAVTGFSAGDKVLLIQMKGAVIDINNSGAFGSITSYSNAGNYEFLTIASITGTTVYFVSNIIRAYSVSDLVQLVRVPQYVNADVTGTLTCAPWDGSTGGVLVFEAAGNVTLNADIDATAKGFRGAASQNGPSSYCGGDYAFTMASLTAGKKGEGIAHYATSYEAGRGALANGGGGGNSVNSGGAGGGNGGSGGNGGNGPPGFCGAVGGVGGYALSYSTTLNKIFLGGGGGAGEANNSGATPGSNGGGIVIIKAASITGNSYSVLAKGEDNLLVGGIDGQGGGGAGGVPGGGQVHVRGGAGVCGEPV